MKMMSDDIMKEILKYFILGWDSNYASWNMIFNNNDKSVVDINGGHRGTVIATTSFVTGTHYWEVSVQDMRTLCVGVTEMPKNPRSLSDKWLGEIGYGISSSNCSVPDGTAFLWSKEQLSTSTLKGFTQKQTVGLLLDMDKYDRTLDLYVDGTRVGTAFSKLPPGPLYPACSNGFDKAFCRGLTIKLELPIPRDFAKNKEIRKKEQAKGGTKGNYQNGEATGILGPHDHTAGPVGSAPPTTGSQVGSLPASSTATTSAADIMKATTPTAASMLAQPPATLKK
ncbi:hypothetical protein GUITHDRAFT_109082 [Guillardia theta CCMP2712]|uniref:B30.2/SPRY domain-containing protein n=1 Tax=Guillardia theta (strain CCMP2712) TaxID=905079 RepID=L1J9M7_GUITC|nr:hypothetical protein GUITHDRAFT_109082 [Guillardia theta CCMP2712]EKX45037.1 hypothetical protein GUITHDRAFT_109082 [Guillardia theta CCMP2712]|eukprot:XP_005832017.1 hypothetical protein GUITHDRAFT_109082 [Guillardia theta CCMP2712]